MKRLQRTLRHLCAWVGDKTSGCIQHSLTTTNMLHQTYLNTPFLYLPVHPQLHITYRNPPTQRLDHQEYGYLSVLEAPLIQLLKLEAVMLCMRSFTADWTLWGWKTVRHCGSAGGRVGNCLKRVAVRLPQQHVRARSCYACMCAFDGLGVLVVGMWSGNSNTTMLPEGFTSFIHSFIHY